MVWLLETTLRRTYLWCSSASLASMWKFQTSTAGAVSSSSWVLASRRPFLQTQLPSAREGRPSGSLGTIFFGSWKRHVLCKCKDHQVAFGGILYHLKLQKLFVLLIQPSIPGRCSPCTTGPGSMPGCSPPAAASEGLSASIGWKEST